MRRKLLPLVALVVLLVQACSVDESPDQSLDQSLDSSPDQSVDQGQAVDPSFGYREVALEWRGTPQERFYNSAVIAKYQCDTCHTVANRGGTVGPILNQVGNRRTEEWIRRWLEDPNAVKEGTKMPKFEFTEEEYEDVVGYLGSMKRELNVDAILASRAPPSEHGEALFKEYDCQACHRLGGEGRFIGPDLTWLGRRKTPEWERVWLRDPDAWKPGTFMPTFDLSP